MSKSSLCRPLFSLIILLLVFLASFPSLTIFNVKANPRNIPPPTLKIQLTSPTNTTYNQNSILINFSIQKQPDDWNHYLTEYAIKAEKKNYTGTFPWMQQLTGISQKNFSGTFLLDKQLTDISQKNFSKTITGIPDGIYSLTISARYDAGLIYLDSDKQKVTFTIDTKIPTPSPMSTPTSSPTPDNQQTLNTETITGIAIIVAVLGAGIGLIIYLLKKY